MKIAGVVSVVFFVSVLPVHGGGSSEGSVFFSAALGDSTNPQLAILGAPGEILPKSIPRPERVPDIAPEWQFRAFPLHAAALADDGDGVKGLVAQGFDVDARDRYGKTPLMVASAFGNAVAAAALLDLGADLSADDHKRGASAIHYAARWGHVGLPSAILLLARGADINAITVRGEAPLHIAAAYSHIGMIELLVRNGAALDAKDIEGVSPLQYARRLGRSRAVETLLRLGSREDGLNDAVNAGDLVRVRELLSSGVPANLRGLAGTALHLAAATGRVAIAAALLDAGADLEAEGDPVDGHPLHVAAVAGKAEIADLLIDRGANIEARDAEGRTPLMVAAAFAKTEVGAFLVQAGADISTIDDMEMAPIHHAAASGDADLVSLLLARGAGVNEQNHLNGMTPLHYAAGFGDLPVIRVLAANGAAFDLRDRTGSTPYDHASRCREFPAMALIRGLSGN